MNSLKMLLAFAVFISLIGCNTVSTLENIPNNFEYITDTANVDYKGVNNVVYYDFSSAKETTLAYDTWHIAFDTDRFIIANSGDYGYYVVVCSTGVMDIRLDLSTWADSLAIDQEKGHFRLVTEESNSLGTNYKTGSGMGSVYTGNVYIIATRDNGFYKMQITGSLPMGAGLRMRIDSLSGNGAVEDTFEIDSDYDYVYVNLASRTAVKVAPPKESWDVRFGRTGDFIMSNIWNGRSSVSINAKTGVEAAKVDSSQLADVLSAGNLAFSTVRNTIGHGWYKYNRVDKVYELLPTVYVIKTTEGHYAKMKMLSFKGPNGESFWSMFKYYYQSDGSTTFSN